MVVAQINSVNYGSTGKIMLGIQNVAKENGIKSISYYAIGNSACSDGAVCRIGNPFFNKLSSKLAHLTGLMGFFSPFATIRLVRNLKKNKVILPKKDIYYTIELPKNTIKSIKKGDKLIIID